MGKVPGVDVVTFTVTSKSLVASASRSTGCTFKKFPVRLWSTGATEGTGGTHTWVEGTGLQGHP